MPDNSLIDKRNVDIVYCVGGGGREEGGWGGRIKIISNRITN